MSTEIRDWQAGDGLRCTYSKRSPIPCGPPVKTAVSIQSGGPRLPARTVRRPLCEHHARGREKGGMRPGQLRAEAERIAHQRLAHEHWDSFAQMVEEAMEHLLATLPDTT